ncbi:MAG: STAS domain-containing protein [Spirochaetota bacterium]
MNVEIITLSKIHTEPTDMNTIAVKLSGAQVLDAVNGPGAMLTLLLAVVRGGIVRAIIDLDGLESIDSRGIGSLISAAKMIREKRGDLALIRVPEHIETVFQPVSLSRFIKIFPTEQEALNYLKYL